MSEGTKPEFSPRPGLFLFQSLFLLDERRYLRLGVTTKKKEVVSILVFIGWAKVLFSGGYEPIQNYVVSILVFIGWAKVLNPLLIRLIEPKEFQSLFLLDERRYWHILKRAFLQSEFQSLFLLDERRYKVGYASNRSTLRRFQSLFLLDERRYQIKTFCSSSLYFCFNPCFYWMSEGTWSICFLAWKKGAVSILVFIGWAKVL